MWQLPTNRLVLSLLLALGFVSGQATCLHAQTIDPVEDLRQALPMRLEDIAAPTPLVLQHRQETIQKKVDALRTIPHLRRALALEEWKEDPTRVLNEKLRLIDANMRKLVGERFTAAVREVVKSGDAHSRLALANLIAEMGPTVRALDPLERGGFARSLAPEVTQLTQDKDLAVRQEALRALGNINARPKDVAPVFKKTLETDTLGPRRLAADGLGQLVRVLNHLQKRGRTTSGVEANPAEVVEAIQEVSNASLAGLKDEDSQVRALCLIAVQIAAQTLADQIPDGFSKRDFPPEGRKLSVDERKLIFARQELAKKEMGDILPGMESLRSHVSNIAPALEDSQALVRLSAVQALEGIGNARLRMRRRVLSVPGLGEEMAEKNKEALAFLDKHDPLAPLLAKDLPTVTRLLGESDTRLRRGVLDFLELLEEAAAPAQPEITAALSDPDRFARWSAARILGLLPPAKASAAVPQLARLLSDLDLNVRMAAAETLEGMGILAKDAAPALAQAVGEGDAEARISAMYVLQGLPAEDAQVALPQLIDAMRHPDPRIRRAAAETLGRLGAAARPAIPTLRRALGDEDNEVRSQSSDAILNINGPGAK